MGASLPAVVSVLTYEYSHSFTIQLVNILILIDGGSQYEGAGNG
jgi:hypothetical protein